MAIKYVREWHYWHAFGSRRRTVYFSVASTEEDVRNTLDYVDGHDNWKKDTLKRGRLVKERENRKSLT